MKLLTTIQIIGSVIRFLAKQDRLWCSVTSFKSLMMDPPPPKKQTNKQTLRWRSRVQYSRKINAKCQKSTGLSCLAPVCNCCLVIAIFFHLMPRKKKGGGVLTVPTYLNWLRHCKKNKTADLWLAEVVFALINVIFPVFSYKRVRITEFCQ